MDMSNLRKMMMRIPVPGEVMAFSPIEAHCVLMAIDVIKDFAPENDPAFTIWNNTFLKMHDEYKLKGVRGKLPPPLTFTPTGGDKAFFSTLVAAIRWHLWCLPLKVEVEGIELNYLLSCDHTPTEHETVLQKWQYREITWPMRFAATRRFLETLSAEEKRSGLSIYAREDVEVAIEIELGLLKEQLTQDDDKWVLELMVETGMLEKEALDNLEKRHNATLKKAEEQLWELYENNFKIMDTE